MGQKKELGEVAGDLLSGELLGVVRTGLAAGSEGPRVRSGGWVP